MTSLNSNPILSLAETQDARELAAITTRAFEVSDIVYPIIWGNTEPGVHDTAVMLLFNPMQSETIVTWKVEIDGKIVGYARWSLPKKFEVAEVDLGEKNEEDNESATAQHKKKVEEGWKTPAGMNFDLFMQKMKSTVECKNRDYNSEKDMFLYLCFVDPAYHKQGIGNLLLQWGLSMADKGRRKICLVSTPQARIFYENSGWFVKENLEINLEAYGRNEIYQRSWMIREARDKEDL
ncbi:uncharacterized protein Bfra_007544 [Botrytis fragariae]|uniref:N-acetyltransferase domain-containing protein n=1 Tax=Botrytis fragariae TaxID=1964551 RepID=A0A8H6AIN3_9HELO|nr:uncharacterized protein Bfra_007544 [Botrytis fragariae]KAF5868346.1 hypothetical protein Bfra_007544 [Botrytis fragariae]